jgi:energy-coupling factor transporter ATP-binding protein EcfA2
VETPAVETPVPVGAAPAAPTADAPVAPAPPSLPVEPPAPAPVPPPPAAPAPDPMAAAAAAATIASPAPAVEAPAFVPASAIRGAAEELGLRLPAGVYATVAAALAGGHVVLVGAAGSGKTTLALAIAKAAAQSGKTGGATVVTAAHGWSARDTVGRSGDEGWERGVVVDAAARGRWLIVDELDRARLDRALGPLSSFLAGVPVTLPDGEAAPPGGWRVVATAGATGLRGSAPLIRRFAHIHVPAPPDPDLHAAIDAAAGGDQVAASAVRRLLGARELGPVGTGAFLAAARFAAARNAAAPADERTLAHEALAAHVAPLLGELDDDGRRRLAALAG